MLHLHLSNRIEALAERLLRELDAPRDELFSPDPVIVPSAGMQRWLTLRIARQQGVCAQVRFHYLATWLWTRLREIDGERSPGLALTPAALAWRVWRAFGDAGFVSRHARLAEDLGNDRADSVAARDEVSRFAFAQQAAAALDAVLSHRPDWLSAWSRGEPAPWPAAADTAAARADEAWQAALWRRVAAELGLREPGEHPLAALARSATLPMPRPLHLFALPSMAPMHAELLQAIARHGEVHVYALNPCREYWFELVSPRRFARLGDAAALAHEVGHPLLAAWGRQTQAHLDTLLDRCPDASIDDELYAPLAGPADTPPSLLAQLHHGLLTLNPPAPGSLTLVDGDRSIELHRCHSLTRELEVLHERLLGLFADDPTLTPGDILVVVPDLAAAAPLIDAVFGTASPERRIAHRVSGLAQAQDSAAARVLLALLDLVASRAPASELFALLQEPLVARRFGVDDEDLASLHDWLRDAGLHHGIDAAHHRAQGLAADARHTLDEALQRLLLGHLLGDGCDEPVDGLLPAGDVEGSRALLLGALARFALALRRLAAAVRAPLPAPGWVNLLGAALDTFVLGEGDEQLAVLALRASLAAWAAQVRTAGLGDDDPLGLDLVRHALREQLDEPARGGVPGGAVTFAAMASLRNLPFQVIAMLGLDGGVFPGRDAPGDVDLLAAAPRRGDRQRRRDDRNLFLDLLLAARSHVHLSCTARGLRDNGWLPPSVLLDELIDFLLDGLCPGDADPEQRDHWRARLCVDHPLQAFAIEPFLAGSDPRIRSRDGAMARALQQAMRARTAAAERTADVDSTWTGISPDAPTRAVRRTDAAEADAAEAHAGEDDAADDVAAEVRFFTRPLPPPAPAGRSLGLDDLARFLRNPAQQLLRDRLQLVLPRDADELADHEPFLLDRDLERTLAQRLLPRAIAGASLDALLAHALAGPDAPAGALGEQQLRGFLESLTRFARRVVEATTEAVLPPQALRLALDVDGEAWMLDAAFADLRAKGLVRWRFAKASATDQLDTWLAQLMLSAAAAQLPTGTAPRALHLATDATLAFAPPADAAEHLRDLLRLVRDGACEPLPFHVRTAEAYARSDGNLDAAQRVWRGRDGVFAESTDAARALAWRGVADPLDERFRATAMRVFGPLREHLRLAPGWAAR